MVNRALQVEMHGEKEEVCLLKAAREGNVEFIETDRTGAFPYNPSCAHIKCR